MKVSNDNQGVFILGRCLYTGQFYRIGFSRVPLADIEVFIVVDTDIVRMFEKRLLLAHAHELLV
jgi:hypothetical protein